MNNQNVMEKLLDGIEVEWKTLGEVGEFTRGKRFVKTDMILEGFPCIHYGEMYTHYGIWAKESKSFIHEDLASKPAKRTNFPTRKLDPPKTKPAGQLHACFKKT